MKEKETSTLKYEGTVFEPSKGRRCLILRNLILEHNECHISLAFQSSYN